MSFSLPIALMTLKGILTYLLKAVFFGLFMAGIFLLLGYILQPDSQLGKLFNINQQSRSDLSFASAVRRAAPAVVNIYSLSVNRQRPLNPGALQGLGSGVLMSKAGYILTNYHVIKKADEIVVALQDGRRFTSEVIGSDPETDLAVIKIEGDNLPTVPLNIEGPALVGDVVLAIGNPYNLGQTITQGIISATGRTGLSSGYQDFLQTDAAINAGNSGGALINTQGYLVGINTAAFQIGGEGGGHGINFAIPTKLAHSIMETLIKDGRVIRGALGVSGEPVTPMMAQILSLPDLHGALITAIENHGPAAKAGLLPGDVIIEFNEETIPSVEMLMDRVAESKPGSEVTLTLVRKGKNYQIPVTIGEKTIKE